MMQQELRVPNARVLRCGLPAVTVYIRENVKHDAGKRVYTPYTYTETRCKTAHARVGGREIERRI